MERKLQKLQTKFCNTFIFSCSSTNCAYFLADRKNPKNALLSWYSVSYTEKLRKLLVVTINNIYYHTATHFYFKC